MKIRLSLNDDAYIRSRSAKLTVITDNGLSPCGTLLLLLAQRRRATGSEYRDRLGHHRRFGS
jgi:hypothetical protein